VKSRLTLATAWVVFSTNALAGSILDYIRDYDLNDYALGLGVSAEQNPYLGAENSAYAYPYLTSFRHSSLTDDWILIRDGELGFRWVTDNGWELGAIGRIQTLGFGNPKTDDLLGMSDRKWALELGPTIGWRGWPVHINWTTYVEPSDRHGGLVSQLAFLLPIETSRGYFVPSIEISHQSDDYANYYYSVTSAEATPLRPIYQASASTNVAAKLRWGYAFSDKWLLTGKIGFEKLGSEIMASPIINRDRVWSAGVALAYNANVFMPREYEGPVARERDFELRISGFNDLVDTKVARDTSDGVPGFETDIEEFLGVADKETVLQVDASVRIGFHHKLEFGYFQLGRKSVTTLASDLEFGDQVFAADTDLNVHVDARVFRAGYAYSLIRNAQLEFSVMAGVHSINLETDINSDSTSQRARSKAGTPLPVVGAQASVYLRDDTKVGAKLQIFRTDFHHYEGSLNFATLDVQHHLTDRVSLGVGYNFYGVKLTSRNNELNGYLKVRHHGPLIFLAAGF
jgi:outer membrane scaffolding protein for murein synthesis (MipA/OmpV family)